MKLLLENWRKLIIESNKKITTLDGPVDLNVTGLFSPSLLKGIGEKGQEVEIISSRWVQGVKSILIKFVDLEYWDGESVEGWVFALDLVMDEEPIQEHCEVVALDESEEYCPACVETMDEAKKKACKPSKGKRFAKRVDGKCRSYGQAGQAKSGGDRIRPGTKKGDAYCARSAGIKKCKNPPCANTLSRKKWKCRGKKSMKSQ